jgi:hypothetical protein
MCRGQKTRKNKGGRIEREVAFTVTVWTTNSFYFRIFDRLPSIADAEGFSNWNENVKSNVR